MRKVLIISIIILFSISGYTQSFSGGLLIGPSLGWLKPETQDVKKDGNRFAFTWGAFVDKNLGDNFAISTGIFINEVGGDLQYTDSLWFSYEENDKVLFQKGSIIDYKIRYIEIPISLKGMTNEIGYLKYHLKLGLSPMIKWKAKGTITTVDFKGSEIDYTKVNITDEVRAFNMAFHVGGGAQFLLGGNTAIYGELLYYNGISDITPDSDEHNNDFNILSHQVMLRVGIKF